MDNISSSNGIIEFVPKNDETIQSMIDKGDIFPEYNLKTLKNYYLIRQK